ncbi:GroES-like protein [Lophium mytilinum]|uniref:GroES-like protein n=1 Tax=Lophium mytilinum TaxID=390894 RepID=A0A6A6QQS6_9PEZI|nr:GroES-like protein [Lophium mytilinum]
MPKQVIVHSSLDIVDFTDTPIPTPKEKEVVIKVVVSGTNPKDWKYPLWYNWPHNSGDDIAGIVHSVGKDVYEFTPGDRVAALHAFQQENGSFAEYATAPDWTTFHVPLNLSFEEAGTIPLSAITAAVALYVDMRLPPPWNPRKPSEERTPILIYGVTSAVGAFAAKYAQLSGLGPIIGVAGRASDFAKTLVDHVVDYRNGEDALVAAVEEFLAKKGLGSKVPNVFDAISEDGSFEATLRFIDPSGTVSTVLPPRLFAKDKKNFRWPPGIKAFNSAAPFVHTTLQDFGHIWSRYLGRLLETGGLKAHPFEVIPGGLNGVLIGLRNLRDGKASAVKYVYRIADTKETPVGKQPLGDPHHHNTHPLRNFPFPPED